MHAHNAFTLFTGKYRSVIAIEDYDNRRKQFLVLPALENIGIYDDTRCLLLAEYLTRTVDGLNSTEIYFPSVENYSRRMKHTIDKIEMLFSRIYEIPRLLERNEIIKYNLIENSSYETKGNEEFHFVLNSFLRA